MEKSLEKMEKGTPARLGTLTIFDSPHPSSSSSSSKSKVPITHFSLSILFNSTQTFWFVKQFVVVVGFTGASRFRRCEGCLWFRRSWVTPWRVFKLMGHCLWLEEIVEDAQPLRWKLCKSFKKYSAQMLDVQFGGSSSILKMGTAYSDGSVKNFELLDPLELKNCLIYESGPKARLLRYAAGALHFAEKGVDPFLVSWNRIVLLHGTPGTGKTSLCKALAQMLSIRFNSRSM
ncbi:PREDICTED: pachytene checkpoint protein 2 homolog [Fragaria vesca subsp. vesca]